MPKDLYNAGRSVGMSAWEIYVRQSLLLNPDIEPLSEREWLSETIGIGTSMLLKVTKDTVSGVHYRDFELPTKSLLCAPNVIVGSLFLGEAVADANGWCRKVTDYGTGIANTSASNPGNGNKQAHLLPAQSMSNVSTLNKRRMMQYIKIQDAIFLQDGIWSNAETSSPAKTFIPDLTKPSMIRIIFQDKINEDFYLLLTGFVTRAIIKGEVGYDMGPVVPDDAADASMYKVENGDFLGPELYPWANKVVFTYPGILNWLLRDGLKSTSKNLGIHADPDTPDTQLSLSAIEAGLGIQVNDPSTLDNRAKRITISSRIATTNNYLKVVQQTKEQTENAEGDSSKIPTKLQGSRAVPAAGVGITQPSTPGEDHKIGAKMAISAGQGHNYIGVSQSAPSNADSVATTLTPSYGQAEVGIGISHPESPGQPFKVSSKIGTSGEGSDYMKVDQIAGSNHNTQTTTLTPSKAVPGKGVGITQPTVPGTRHRISSKMSTDGCGKNYISITQPENENRTADDVSTVLHPTKIAAGKGIAITQPSTPGNDVQISSIIITSGKKEAPNYIKVEQEAHDTGCGCGCGDGKGANTRSTILSPSLLVAGKRTVIKQPTTPGGDIEIGINLNFIPGLGIGITDSIENGNVTISSIIQIAGDGAKGLNVAQSQEANANNASTILYPSKHVADDTSRKLGGAMMAIKYPSSSGGHIEYQLDPCEILRRAMEDEDSPLRKFINSLLNKIFGGGTLQPDGSIKWPNEYKIPIGDLNIYSNGGSSGYKNAIRSRDEGSDNDLQVK